MIYDKYESFLNISLSLSLLQFRHTSFIVFPSLFSLVKTDSPFVLHSMVVPKVQPRLLTHPKPYPSLASTTNPSSHVLSVPPSLSCFCISVLSYAPLYWIKRTCIPFLSLSVPFFLFKLLYEISGTGCPSPRN